MRPSKAENRGQILRSGCALVKGIDVGFSSHFRFTRLWLFLSEDELLFFKEPPAALSKPNASIPCSAIKSCSTDSLKANCLRMTYSSRIVYICFKTAQELKLWANEIEACLQPVLVIGNDVPSESFSTGEDISGRFPLLQSTQSKPYRNSALSGTTLGTSTLSDQRFSSWSASTAHDWNNEEWPELSQFKMNYEDDLWDAEEMKDVLVERPSSPVDPELVFELDRVHLAVSYCPGREIELDIVDLTGQVSKLDDHAVASGGFSDIWRGRWDANDYNKFVAIKVIRSFWSDPKTDAKLQKRLNQELDIWKRLRHNHIVPLFGVVHDMGRYASMISPWMNNGNASKFFEGQDIERTLVRRLKLLYEVASGLEYLHCFSPPVVHGDLKASNILISDTGHALLTDFGISTIIEESTGVEHTASTFAGSVRWMAFELFSAYAEGKGSDESQGSVQLSTYSDIWSFGSTALEILSGRVPYFYRKRDVQVLHEVLLSIKPLHKEVRAAYSNISQKMWTFLHSCWRDDPRSRPSARQVKESMSQFFRERQRMGIIFEENIPAV